MPSAINGLIGSLEGAEPATKIPSPCDGANSTVVSSGVHPSRSPLIPIEINSARGIEADPLLPQQEALEPVVVRAGPRADPPLGIDHTLPGNWPVRRQCMQSVTDLACSPGEAGQCRHLAIGRDSAPGNPADNLIDAMVRE